MVYCKEEGYHFFKRFKKNSKFLDLRDLIERSNKISMLCVNDQNLNWGYLFSLVLFHSLNGFVSASLLYAILSSISNTHNLTWRTCLVCETLEPDNKDSEKPPLAVSEFKTAATQPLQSNQSPNALKYAISMWSPSNIIKNLQVPYCSGYCQWIRLAMTYIGWPSTATTSWLCSSDRQLSKSYPFECLIIAVDLESSESSQHIDTIPLVSGLVVADQVLLALIADKK